MRNLIFSILTADSPIPVPCFFESFPIYWHLMDEKQLIERAKAGDFSAFTELVEAHKVKLFALVRRLAGNEQDAEDIMQETLLKAIDKIDTFRGDSSFGTWIYAIALNEARGHIIREKQRDLRSIEDYLPDHDGRPEKSTAHHPLFEWEDPHRRLESKELRRIIEEGMQQLPYNYREAFVLRFIEDLPVKEVAALIGESEAAAKSRILRARLALREFLAGKFEVSHDQKMS
ncbi:putative RNA polymerase sigma-H factor [Candidatus Zixiibacteriota bacterium]|nr:putative RNA polymerase sigma-H factor [candidate division Zixibacteria bacterium]